MSATRINTLALVKHGFTREEIFFMPISEYQDYIRILNDEAEKEENEMKKNSPSNSSDSVNDVKMAGNSLPPGFF